jgi:hypothetical protein
MDDVSPNINSSLHLRDGSSLLPPRSSLLAAKGSILPSVSRFPAHGRVPAKPPFRLQAGLYDRQSPKLLAGQPDIQRAPLSHLLRAELRPGLEAGAQDRTADRTTCGTAGDAAGQTADQTAVETPTH